MHKTILRATGFEFAPTDDLQRDEDFARYRGDRKLLLRILLERQHRRWSNAKRQQFSGLSERWYLTADRNRSRVGHTVTFSTPAVIVDETDDVLTIAIGVDTLEEPISLCVNKTDPSYWEK